MKQCGAPEASDQIIERMIHAMGEDNDGVALICISDNVFDSCFFFKHILMKLYEVEKLYPLITYPPYHLHHLSIIYLSISSFYLSIYNLSIIYLSPIHLIIYLLSIINLSDYLSSIYLTIYRSSQSRAS